MQKSELFFEYPEHLVATERKPVSRVMMIENGQPHETSVASVVSQIEPGDVLVINETKVIPARVRSESGLEILFLQEDNPEIWQVLCPSRRWPKGETQRLPNGVEIQLFEKGLPQKVKVNKPLSPDYFFEYGEMPLPPYIQEARGERTSRPADKIQYQTDWAEQLGSLAAPTASFHFSDKDLQKVRNRGAEVVKICLHVGLGTFLPIHSDNLEDHIMHPEQVVVSQHSWQKILEAKQQGGKIWALGSTVTRALESQALGLLQEDPEAYRGETRLFIKPGFPFKIVDRLLTNFHQPESTLLAMVMAFAGIENVKSSYQWAIERNFRLFSYGDLSLWIK